MATMSDTFIRGEVFEDETGLKTGAQLEDLVSRAYPRTGSQLVDQSSLETYEDTGVQDDDGNNIYRLRAKAGGITNAMLDGDIALTKLSAAAQAALLNPSGSIITFAAATAPTGYLECNGAAVSRTTYADLFAVIASNYGQGDGSTSFNLPDLRGVFLRGYDHAAGNDPNAATRTAQATGGKTGDNVGSEQADVYKAHTHTTKIGVIRAGTNTSTSGSDNSQSSTGLGTWTATSASSGGDETRPKNVYVMYCIKT